MGRFNDRLNGAKLLIKCLKELEVDTIFGYPGGSILPIYDALYDEKDIKHILTAHEQGATHAADGYARVTGKVGIVLVTSGPGATNTVTGIANAYRDSIPMVVFTGQVPKAQIGKAAFQEVDILGITKPITKKNFLVTDIKELTNIVYEAFKIAKEGRMGPVLVDIPKDVQKTIIDNSFKCNNIYKNHVVNNDNSEEDENLYRNLNRSIELINNSKKPIIYAGGGIISANAHEELKEFSETIKCPVVCTLMGLGGFPANHKYFMGLGGMHGTLYSNYAITESDLLIAIGVRFNDRVTSNIQGFAPNAKIIHIDIDEKEFGKNIDIDVPLKGDVRKILKLLIKNIEVKEEGDWNCKVDKWKSIYPLTYNKNYNLSGEYIIEKLNEITNGDCVICTEVGQNQIWAAQYFKYLSPRTFISSGGLGTMGFGLGAAIGAYFGNTRKRVINIAGDGSFKMNCSELDTIARYNIPIIQVVLNNSCLGMVRQWQEMFYNKKFSYSLFNGEVDFVKLGAAYGIKSFRITKKDEIKDVFINALELNEPVIIDCVIDRKEKVFPIVPPGESINNMMVEKI
ncbi:biosynthetic-type acetolactate synthase large subunit [Clostridium botulinum]|uniref:biosynthetic-type acetolactate synthase large subunit n=1 Tax=Clostridium botulinum TaxID=1491 RepID=UPI0004D5BDC1|nr:biosynthetic-type acetolactate synthase large subunit [Clostridium botulinum]KEI07044.1 acetolactate synthase catalytic subunit [Clostridium botulinum C/D str. BKT75002]KEI12121.1 acetolactate synthase catalytic subunit [Clostridium botulinum C/D str. BKT2873]QPW59475.1 biosynthetic-type acetolactate synthase large subunit [Clostridium botulinum]